MAGAWHRVFKARATEADGEPVKRLAPVALLALAALAAACGSGGAGPAADPAPELPDPAALVLHASDLGPGYVRQASATKPITLAHELLHESPPPAPPTVAPTWPGTPPGSPARPRSGSSARS
jgi:hypothetical protein